MIIGTNLENNSDFELDVGVYMRTHTFMQGMTGSGKTAFILKKVETLKKEIPDAQLIFLDDQEEFTDIPKFYSDFRLISRDTVPKIFTVQHAKQIGIQTRKLGFSIVVNLHDFAERKERNEFIAEFLKGFKSLGKKVGTPAKIFIDEADQYCPRLDKKDSKNSKEEIIDLAKRGRKFNITLVLSTQYLSEVDISARRECANRIVGKTTELSDRRVVRELMGLTEEEKEELFDFTAGYFYVRGEMFKKGVSKIFVPESGITRKQAGVDDSVQVIVANDIFEEAVENKNEQNLVELLQSKIGDLEKQLADKEIKIKEAYEKGFIECDTEWRNKSRVVRFLK